MIFTVLRVWNQKKIVKQEHIKFYHNKLIKTKGDSKGTYGVVNRLLNNVKEKKLPECSDPVQLAQNFEKYFKDKITSLYVELDKEADKSLTLNSLRTSHKHTH